MTQKELMADDTQYCCYCGGEKVRFQCCGENHFQTFAQMPADEQDEFLDNEECAPLYTSTQQHKPWVGLTPEDYDSMRPRVPDIVNDFTFADVAAIVEAKLKEKNNG